MSCPRTPEDANAVFQFGAPGSNAVFHFSMPDASAVFHYGSDLQKDVRHSEGGGPLRVSGNTSELADRGTTVDDLPDELVLEIFSYMSSSENINVVQKVCTRWKRLAQDAQLWCNWKYVMGKDTSEEEAIATFAAVPQLRTALLYDTASLSPEVFDALARCCPHLTRLHMSWVQELTYSDAVNLFAGCNKIHTLGISYYGQPEDSRLTDAVALLTDLRELRLRHRGPTDLEIPLHILAESCPHLCSLYMGGLYYKMRDAEYFIRTQKNVLKRLSINWTSVEGRNVARLLPACAETLESLELWHPTCDWTREDAVESVPAVGQLRNLQQLQIGIQKWELSHLLATVFENGGLPKLQQLELYGDVIDETVRAVSEHCPELRDLSLMACEGHSDALFESLCRLPKLEKLKIHNCFCMGEEAMSYIAKLPALHTLHFSYFNLRLIESSVDYILEMSGLRRLILEECVCWDVPFDEFPGRLVNLRELEIDHCAGDDEMLDRIRAEMPDVRVKAHFGGCFVGEDDGIM